MSDAGPHRRAGDMFHRTVPATDEAVRAALDEVARWMEAYDLSPEMTANALIVLGEVLNNIVEHALPEMSCASVRIDVSRTTAGLFVETADPGRPLPHTLLAQASLPDAAGPVADLPEGGFGWFIIHSLARDMVYEREAGENRLSFSFAA